LAKQQYLSTVSMTTFADFVMKSGTPKATVVKRWKHKPDYSPSTDYYRGLREAIVESHSTNSGFDPIDRAVANSSQSRSSNYKAMAKSYKRWLGKKKPVWFQPNKRTWSANKIAVNVRPELGLDFSGTEHAIKLYFKADPIAKNRAVVLLQLMAESFPSLLKRGGVVSILDVRQGKLFTATASNSLLSAQLQGEAAYWASVWPAV